MKLRKCPECEKYTLKENCKNCKEKTKNAHYKFIRKTKTTSPVSH